MGSQNTGVLGHKPALIIDDEPEQVLENLKGVSCLLTIMASTDIGTHKNIGEAYLVLAHIIDASTVSINEALANAQS